MGEEIGLPEQEVDKLERCITKCWWRNKALDFVGQAYEEKRENWEEYRTGMGAAGDSMKKLVPCKECCGKLPNTLFGADSIESSPDAVSSADPEKVKKFPKLYNACFVEEAGAQTFMETVL